MHITQHRFNTIRASLYHKALGEGAYLRELMENNEASPEDFADCDRAFERLARFERIGVRRHLISVTDCSTIALPTIDGDEDSPF